MCSDVRAYTVVFLRVYTGWTNILMVPMVSVPIDYSLYVSSSTEKILKSSLMSIIDSL